MACHGSPVPSCFNQLTGKLRVQNAVGNGFAVLACHMQHAMQVCSRLCTCKSQSVVSTSVKRVIPSRNRLCTSVQNTMLIDPVCLKLGTDPPQKMHTTRCVLQQLGYPSILANVSTGPSVLSGTKVCHQLSECKSAGLKAVCMSQISRARNVCGSLVGVGLPSGLRFRNRLEWSHTQLIHLEL